jgi:hypothetical protein
MAEGEIYPISDAMPEHPQGRCMTVPVLLNHAPPEWERGEAWFVKQDESLQIGILGTGRYNAWAGGKISLNQLVRRNHDDEWGGSITATPLKDLIDAP